jgi:hypothetical protein
MEPKYQDQIRINDEYNFAVASFRLFGDDVGSSRVSIRIADCHRTFPMDLTLEQAEDLAHMLLMAVRAAKDC